MEFSRPPIDTKLPVEGGVQEPVYLPQPPDPLDPNEKLAPLVKAFYRLKKSKWFAPILIVVLVIAAAAIGYRSFMEIYSLEVRALHSFNVDSLTDRGLLLMATVEQITLGVLALIFFIISKKWYLPLFLYAGFIAYWLKLTYANEFFSFMPTIIYALEGMLLALGFKFLRTWGILLLIITILGQADYNSYIINGRHLFGLYRVSYQTEEFTEPNSPSFPEKTATKQEATKTILWCHNFKQGLSYGAYVQEVSELQEALRRLGYIVTDKDGLYHESTEAAVKEFQVAHHLLETGTLESDTREALNKLYNCGTASKYGLALGPEDIAVSSITTASSSSSFSGIEQGYTVNFDISEPPLGIEFISRDYKGGASNGTDYPSLNYSFATNFTGNKALLRSAVCDPVAIADMAILLGSRRITLIACKEIDSGYIGYVTYEHFQAPEILLYALAAISTGSTQFPAAYAEAQLDDAILNESRDDGTLSFPDKPALSPTIYIQTVTNEFSNPNSQIATAAVAFEAFVRSVRTKP